MGLPTMDEKREARRLARAAGYDVVHRAREAGGGWLVRGIAHVYPYLDDAIRGSAWAAGQAREPRERARDRAALVLYVERHFAG